MFGADKIARVGATGRRVRATDSAAGGMRDQFGGLLVALIQPISIHAGHSRRRQNENPEDSKVPDFID
jgi:hypothetical protein